MIIAGFNLLNFPAYAEDDFITLRDYSETHCQLLQSASLKPSPTMGKRIEELIHTPDEFYLESQYEHAPDFGFLLPKYWPVMSWAQRVRFNHGITALIKRRMQIPQQQVKPGDCDPQIRIIEHPNQEEDESQSPLPRPAKLKAIILMNIRGKLGAETPLTYLLSKEWNIGWQLEDTLIHTNSVKDRDSKALEEVIRTQGLDELEVYIDQLLSKE